MHVFISSKQTLNRQSSLSFQKKSINEDFICICNQCVLILKNPPKKRDFYCFHKCSFIYFAFNQTIHLIAYISVKHFHSTYFIISIYNLRIREKKFYSKSMWLFVWPLGCLRRWSRWFMVNSTHETKGYMHSIIAITKQLQQKNKLSLILWLASVLT